MDVNELFEQIAIDIVGHQISNIWRGHGSAVFFEFGDLMPATLRDGSPGEPKGQFTIMIEWSWRIESQTAILCGSFSDEDLWQPTFTKTLGAKVRNLKLFSRLPEIELSLDDGHFIVSFATVEGDPEWALFDNRPEARTWISVANGKLVQEK